jgi:hypothetical protein
VPSGVLNENLFQPDYRVETSDLPYSIKVYRNSTNQKMYYFYPSIIDYF